MQGKEVKVEIREVKMRLNVFSVEVEVEMKKEIIEIANDFKKLGPCFRNLR